MTGSAQATDASQPTPGYTWALLDAERQDVRAALLSALPPTEQQKAQRTPPDEAQESSRQRIEELQMRLGQVDRAIDRLMAGSYSLCERCAEPIEQKWLAADQAATLCYACQTGVAAGSS